MAAEITNTIKNKAGKVLAVFYDDGTIRIDGVRLSYPHVDKPWGKPTTANPNPKKVYSASVIMPKVEFKAVKDALVEHNKTLMAEAKIDFVKPDAKYMIDGDQTGKPENEGAYVIRTREERRPFTKGLKNENLSPDEALAQLYGGCYVSILIRPWAQKSQEWGKRLNCGLTGLRKVKVNGEEGDAFGEGRLGDDEVGDRFADAAPDEENGGFDSDDSDEL